MRVNRSVRLLRWGLHDPVSPPRHPLIPSFALTGVGSRGLATGADEDEAAKQRRMEALRRFGVSDKEGSKEQGGGKPITVKAAADGTGEGNKKEGEEEVDYNEVWKDYISYMEHQRDQGWKT